jgi:excisionase family DNA binding protein
MEGMELQPVGYRYEEAAKLLTLSKSHIYNLLRAKRLERLQVTEGRFVISRESLVAYMDAVKARQDMTTYVYKPKPQRSNSSQPAQEEKKGVVSGLLARFGLGNNTVGS